MLTPTYITYMCVVFSGVIRGVGEALIPMIVTGLPICVFRVVFETRSCRSTTPWA